eukprot:TRINITY_DN837_c0_g2_i1.p1 TRINITY_DN837_c0_g2~~TRINITY_DN837_c0_g2_i1.p1  ORF type:complete len:867 (+),score=565.97 TRINITY_DN837_c0_g2_i1:229-2829(+)
MADYGRDSDSDSDRADLEVENPLLRAPQEALTRQLTAAKERLLLEKRERAESLRRAEAERAEVGTELYQVQQQLARLQMTLEAAHDNSNIMARLRSEAEEDLREASGALEGKERECAEVRRVHREARAELERLQNQLRQFENRNDEMRNKIAVTRRATYRAEENMVQVEDGKRKQDGLIDSMNETLRRQQEELGLYEAQLIAQRKETVNARETLAQATAEMEIIHMEKKQLVQQWQSSLVAMQRRDEALQTTEEALRKQREQIYSLDGEISALRAKSVEAQKGNEKLTLILGKLEAETRALDRNDTDFKDRKDRMMRDYARFKATMEATEAELATVVQESKRVQLTFSTYRKEVQAISSKIKAMEDTISQNVSQQTTLSRAAAYTEQGQSKLRSQLQEQEMQVGELKNEMARIRMDILNTEQHNTTLSTTLEELVAALREKEGMIDKYRVEIRRRNDEIEKKQAEVDKLNRKYDSLTSGTEDASVGPLEATMRNLQKTINARVDACAELQREWVGDQTLLVRLEAKRQAGEDGIAGLAASETVLRQKHLRLEASITQLNTEIRGLQRGLDAMHVQMTKLNDSIATHTAAQTSLADANVLLEQDFAHRLAELEAAARALETKITDTKAEKASLLESVLQTEAEMMVWEKKTQLGKETHAVVTASRDGDEASTMKKEIHRMRLRFDQLKRRQETLVKEMERAIYKREDIAGKYKAKGKSGPVETRAKLRASLSQLRKQVGAAQDEAAELDTRIKDLARSQQTATDELEEATEAMSEARAKEEAAQDSLEDKFVEKQASREALLRYRRFIERYVTAGEDGYELSCAPERLEEELGELSGRQDGLIRVLDEVADRFPFLRADVRRAKTVV